MSASSERDDGIDFLRVLLEAENFPVESVFRSPSGRLLVNWRPTGCRPIDDEHLAAAYRALRSIGEISESMTYDEWIDS